MNEINIDEELDEESDSEAEEVLSQPIEEENIGSKKCCEKNSRFMGNQTKKFNKPIFCRTHF